MNALAIVLIVLAAVVLVLAIGGTVAAARRQRGREALLRQQMSAANEDLARARATDRGWEKAVMESAAREAVAGRVGGAQITELLLVQVVDRPGTDADEAIFHVRTADGEHTVKLGRRDGAWIAAGG